MKHEGVAGELIEGWNEVKRRGKLISLPLLSRVRPFRFKIFFAYKRNKANLDPFHMCFTISL
jgi:hypothetical protein